MEVTVVKVGIKKKILIFQAYRSWFRLGNMEKLKRSRQLKGLSM